MLKFSPGLVCFILQSIILPVHNGDRWLNACLESVHEQTFGGQLQLSIYLDACTVRYLLYHYSLLLRGNRDEQVRVH